MHSDYIVSLDIGSAKVRAIVGEINNGTLQIVGVGTAESQGIKKGAIVDIDQTVQSISEAVEQAGQIVGIDIGQVIVGINGNHIELHASHGVVAVSSEDREIGQEDISRVLQASCVIATPPEREIIDVVPKQYMVDGLSGITDPRGMIGVRLEVETTIVTGSKTILHNTIRCVEKAGLGIAAVYLLPLACSEVALSKDEKQLGVVLADIGAGATTIAVFERGKLVATRVLPVGGEYITNDLAIGFRTHFDVAEKIKLTHGCADLDEASSDTTFKVPTIGSDKEYEFSQLDLAEIVEPRVEEIFHLIALEVEQMGYSETFAGGYVLTGGVMSLPGALTVARSVLGSSVRRAEPDDVGVKDPSYTSGVGLIRFALKKQPGLTRVSPTANSAKKKRPGRKQPFFQRIKDWFNEMV
nr:cell division protein FtsA [Numidum massiliense]